MGTFGPIHWIVVAVIVLLLFGGRGRLSGMMGDAAKGIKAFREGLKDEGKDRQEAHEEEEDEPPAKPLPRAAATKTSTTKKAAPRAKSKTVS